MTDIECVIFDWAGTTIDFGSLDPVLAFQSAFNAAGIPLDAATIRQDMGVEKHEHIAKLAKLPAVQSAWFERYQRGIIDEDQLKLFNYFEQFLINRLINETVLTPYVLQTQAYLKKHHIHLATTTGYTRSMLTIAAKQAALLGYQPEMVVSKEDVAAGRPAPDMINHIMAAFNITNPQAVVKVGDTVVDMQEGKNAGVITVGLIESSSLLGLSQAELIALPQQTRIAKFSEITATLKAAGADYVIHNLSELPALLTKNKTRQKEHV
ncbi:phosphonoacetaldehyde hydrolase [Latilactobacillus curvatus]|uniref:phosphonoacetaldehyde hydrolase n=1 Tax=Latilactobacillus curvatus TaxID=28038 RepID=UPI000FECD31B|nr:phosphonoacetaldehyde hydrolase [Latilactobacillus curvatus]QAR34857.1 phosphonoacetaldehyde hydrolase [Latilactobacillus curvatus]